MVGKFRKRISGLITLKKIVYLISPKEINRDFYSKLDKATKVNVLHKNTAARKKSALRNALSAAQAA